MVECLFKELEKYAYSEDFPNDVLVFFPQELNGYESFVEGMYVRIKEKLDDDIYTGILLNENVIEDCINYQCIKVLVLMTPKRLIGLPVTEKEK